MRFPLRVMRLFNNGSLPRGSESYDVWVGCPVAHDVCAPFELKVFIGNNAVFCVYTVRVLWPVFLFSFSF